MFRKIIFANLLALSLAQSSLAQDPASVDPSKVPSIPTKPTASSKEESKDEVKVLKPGVIASYGRQARTSSVDAVATSAAGEKESASPIGASIVHVKEGSCEAKISNSDKKSGYSISFEVQSVGKDGKVQSRTSYSQSLKAGETVSKHVSCKSDANMAVVLKSGKKIGS